MRKLLSSIANLTDRNSKQMFVNMMFNEKNLYIYRCDELMTFVGCVKVSLDSEMSGVVSVLAQKLGAALEYCLESDYVTFEIGTTFVISGHKDNAKKSFHLETQEADQQFDMLSKVIAASDSTYLQTIDLEPVFCKHFGKILSDQRLKPKRVKIQCESGSQRILSTFRGSTAALRHLKPLRI